MREERRISWGWALAFLFFVGILLLNAFPPDPSQAVWKDPLLILIVVAMAAVFLVGGKSKK
jgi:hypothetical protein